MRYEIGQSFLLRDWVAVNLQVPPEAWHRFGTLAIIDEQDEINAAIIFTNNTGFDIDIHIYSVNPRWASRETFNVVGKIAFELLGVTRITAITSKTNKRARILLERLGFKLEGVARKGFDGKRDSMSYGLLKDEWQNGKFYTSTTKLPNGIGSTTEAYAATA